MFVYRRYFVSRKSVKKNGYLCSKKCIEIKPYLVMTTSWLYSFETNSAKLPTPIGIHFLHTIFLHLNMAIRSYRESLYSGCAPPIRNTIIPIDRAA